MTNPSQPEPRATNGTGIQKQAASVPNTETACAPLQAMLYCPACSCRLLEHRCKLTCPRCGYYMSCSDYY